MSNLVTELDAVVWNRWSNRYVVKTFRRWDNDISPFLCHLGRTIVTRVKIKAAKGYNLRLQSYTNITMNEVFAAPGSSGPTFQSFLEQTGRVDLTFYPYNDAPWLRVWSVADTQPAGSRAVTGPYNFGFVDGTSKESDQVTALIKDDPSSSIFLSQLSQQFIRDGITQSNSADVWGAASDLQRYESGNITRAHAAGFVVHCCRADVQRVLYDFNQKYQTLLNATEADGKYALNMQLEIRVTDIDRGYIVPNLSPGRPFDRSSFDTVVYISPSSIVNMPNSMPLFRELELWAYSYYPSYAGIRAEWSKGWGYTDQAPWQNSEMVSRTIPMTYGNAWWRAVMTFNKYDPFGIYSSPLLDIMGL
jgi:hypothetical protein